MEIAYRALLDPRTFNAVLIFMFFATAARWALACNWPQTLYWFAGGVINVAVTFMDK